ncbi:MAG TPA: transcription termination/antitermination NusG family protein [Casimicrobiaceae bacterium]|jgi:transcriptional antiterminator RfaH
MTAQRKVPAPVTDEAGARALLRAPRASSWYALHVLANAEFVVESALIGYGIEAFLPTYAEKTQWSDRVTTTIRPLFPGYLFVNCEGRPSETIVRPRREILRIAGIIKVLPTNLNPQPVDREQIENVRRALAARLPVTRCEYQSGDEVLIDKGPLAGVKGIVQRTKRGTEVIIRIEMLQRSVCVQVDAADVLKATT